MYTINMIKSLSRKIIYLYAIGTFIGPSVLSLNLVFMHLSINRILIAIMWPLVILSLFIKNKQRDNKLGMPKCCNQDKIILFFVFWLFYALLTSLWCVDLYAWLRSYYFLFCGVTVIIFFSGFINSIKDIQQIATIFMLMAVMHGIIGCHEMLTGQYMFEVGDIQAYMRDHLPVSSYYNVNGFAMVMLLGVYSALSVYLFSEKLPLKLFSLATINFLGFMCLASRSRAIIFGLIFSIICAGIFCRKFRLKLVMAIASMLLIAISAYIFMVLIGEKTFNYNSIFSLSFSQEGSSDSVRLNLIKNGLIFLKAHLFMGCGLGNIEHYMAAYNIYNTHGITNIHNWWMEILVSCGIFVFLGYCWFYFSLLRNMILVVNNTLNKNIFALAYPYMCFLFAFIVASVSASSNLGVDVIWTYFAIIVASNKLIFIQKL